MENIAPHIAILDSLIEEEGIQRIDLSEIGAIDPEVIGALPQEIAVKYKVIPFSQDMDTLKIAMANPFDIDAQDAIQAHTSLRASFCFTPEAQLDEWLDKIYLQDSMSEYEGDGVADFEIDEEVSTLDLETSLSRKEDVPAIRYVNNVLLNAIQERASDIHIEPQEKRVSIRFRIDGALREIASPPRNLLAGIVSRIKVLSSLDIAERRVPQDGRSKLKIFGRFVDVRVSTLPTINGEKVVLRILDKDLHSLNIQDLGIEEDLQKKFRRSLSAPHGMILVTGPTGSGKTTTLYSALNYVNLREKNIVTIEDPVEYQLKGINQVQAKPAIGLSFSAGLRSILRQDPDIIMVGEIRDLETAEIAMRSSLTGHLVFSTLHTNSSAATIMRLIDMGIDRYLICSSLNLIIAQRLIRRICFHCSEEYQPDESVLERFAKYRDLISTLQLRRGKGCLHCSSTGYWGRVAIFEFLPIDNAVRQLIIHEAGIEEIQAATERMETQTLFRNGLQKVIAGVTTLDEILRITSD